jgi:small-conductance mechanosensitive channel
MQKPKAHPQHFRLVPFWRGIVLALFLGVTFGAVAQEAPAPTEPDSDLQVDEETFLASVIVDGAELFVVRGFSAFPAQKRADKIQDRIVSFSERPNIGPVSMTLSENEFGLGVLANGHIITTTTQADADYEELELSDLANLQAEAVKTAILSFRENRSTSARVESVLAAVAWTIGFFIICFGFFRKRSKFILFVKRQIERRSVVIEAKTQTFVRGQAISEAVGYLLNIVFWVGGTLLFYYYLSFVLMGFVETRPAAELLLNHVSQPMIDVVLGAIRFVPSLIVLVIITAIARMAIQGLRLFFKLIRDGVIEFGRFEEHWINPTFMLARVVVIVIALIFAYPYIPGSGSQAFQGLALLAGIMFSLGSNTVVSNLMAGLFVIYRRSTNIGDRIQVGERIGDVYEIKLMETLIKSTKNEMISIPNSQLLSSVVVNYTRQIDGNGLLVHASVGIGYEEPPEKIIAMLIEAAHRTKSLKKKPEPFVLWTKLADFSINYEVNAYTSRGGHLPQIQSDLHQNIVMVFNENTTQIMTPFYTSDPEKPKLSTEAWRGELAHNKKER